MRHNSPILKSKLSRRRVLAYGAATALSTPFISRAWAAPVEINMLAWYGHGEPDIVAEFEAANNCLLYTSPSPRDATLSRMPSSA